MGDLKAIGSEKLTGQDKLKRIMEIARFNEVLPSNINETAKSEYSIPLADGNKYEIVRERQGYILKKTISETETDYIEPMKNRKYYSSYSQALKTLNLVAGELNRLNENEEGVSLYGEQKKFVLKTPKPVEEPSPIAAVPAAPPAVPAPSLPPAPSAEMPSEDGMGDMGMDMGPEGDVEMGSEMDMESPDNEGDETVSFRTIQKLTGKLTQKIRTLDNQEGMTSEDIKYVINMVLSSLNLKSLSEEDKEDIMGKFDEESEDLGGDDMDGMDMTDDSEVEDIQSDMDVAIEGEMDEDMYGSFGNPSRKDFRGDKYYDENERQVRDSELYGIAGDDFDTEEFETFQKLYDKYGDEQPFFRKSGGGEKMFDLYKEKTGRPFKIKTRRPMEGEMEEDDYGNGAIFDSIFGESKVDKVISKYFELTKKEILENKQPQTKKNVSQVSGQMKEVIKLSETIEQELAAQKFLQKNSTAKIVGLTNKKNLVFENKGKQVKISPEGLLV